MRLDCEVSAVPWCNHLHFLQRIDFPVLFLQVVIDAFRLINANMMVLGHEPRQTTSNLGHLNKPSIQVFNINVLNVA